MPRYQGIVIAGFGGQGILSIGRILAQAGMSEGMNVSWLPSYGPEIRGGTAYCHVILSDGVIGSPLLNSATALIAMNRPSYEKYAGLVCEGGLVIVDSSLVNIGEAGEGEGAESAGASASASSLGAVESAGASASGSPAGAAGSGGASGAASGAAAAGLAGRRLFCIPATKTALDNGNAAFANIILAGKLLAETGAISTESFEQALRKVLSKRYQHLIPKEMEMLRLGMEA
ncbi:MAG: 2-oxoacid:acceptor oxidoreductase family protein [Clostridiales bacterium]|jgi:2-oxoglutarate ferredoxin oxidoreductase subunit gamma|nr:2-oxoacid:acceptor oxidoreductase family protein [Clostridiales bacterium]